MGLFGWWKTRTGPRTADPLEAWRRDWAAAVAAEDFDGVDRLRAALDAMGLSPDDVEIEREMLDGLAALAVLTPRLRAGDRPVVDTGHRVVGADICHASAPASIPDDPAQPAGRVMLTGQRAIFAGGGRATSVAWHRVAQVVRIDRDVLLILGDRDNAQRFRFNSFTDALCAEALARDLAQGARRRTAAL